MKVIVIDDEPHAREDLIHLLNEYEDIEVVAECDDVFSALRAVREHQPDVMFLDIILPGHDGFTLLDYMDNDEYRPHVVIVSGGPSDFAVRAYGEGVMGYLAKPIEEELLKKSLERLRTQLTIPNEKAKPYPDRELITIPCIFNRIIKFVKKEDIEYVHSDPLTGVHIASDGKSYFTELTLKRLIKKVILHQSHRQYLFAKSFVDKYERIENGLGKIYMQNGDIVPVARSYRNYVEQVLGIRDIPD